MENAKDVQDIRSGQACAQGRESASHARMLGVLNRNPKAALKNLGPAKKSCLDVTSWLAMRNRRTPLAKDA